MENKFSNKAKSIVDWFIADCLRETENYIDHVKIRLTFFVLFGTLIVVSVLALFSLILKMYISFGLASLALCIFIVSLYILKVKKNVRLANFIIVGFSFGILTLTMLMENKMISVFYVLYLFASCVFTFFLLGKKVGRIYAFGTCVVTGVYIHFFMYSNFQVFEVFSRSMLWMVFATVIVAMLITIFILTTFMNVRDHIEIKLDEQNKMLVTLNEITKNALEVQEQFITNTNHEIRTPMNAIHGFTEILLNQNLTLQQREYVSIIKVASQNLIAIVDDILDYSSLSVGNITLNNSWINLKIMLNETLALFKLESDKKGVKLFLENTENIPHFIYTDRKRLVQILINVIGNALKFTAEGSIKIVVEHEIVSDEYCQLMFKIKDTGIGIPIDKQTVIFDKFVQVDAEITRKYGGTGLGLAITKSLVKMLGGEINLSSEINIGTEVNIIFGVNFKMNLIGEELSNVDLTFLGEIKVLLVDDNQINKKLVMESLKISGPNINIDTANNGKEAILKMSNREYDLILLDLYMPEMDGYETAIYIRQILKSDVTIIALTADSMGNAFDKCLAAGMDDVLNKPFEINELISSISHNLEGKIFEAKEKNDEVFRLNFSLDKLRKISKNDKELKTNLMTIVNEIDHSFRNAEVALFHRDWKNVRLNFHSIKNNAFYLGSTLFLNLIEISEAVAEDNNLKKLNTPTPEILKEKWTDLKEDILDFVAKE